MVAASLVFCSWAFAIISGWRVGGGEKVPGRVTMVTPDGALVDCGSVSRSEPRCKRSMLAAC